MLCSSRLSMVLATVVMSTTFLTSYAKKFLQFEPLSKEDVDKSIAEELAGLANQTRLREIERELQVVFTALPKNEYGGLNHQAVRYILHRFFLQQHGWYVRGLEPNGLAQNPSKPVPLLKDWTAPYIQERFEERTQIKGIGLADLAALAATLEDLIRKEAASELKEVYEVLNYSPTQRIPRDQAEEVVTAYMMIFLTNRNVSLSSRKETQKKIKIFETKYRGWNQAKEFLQNVEERHSGLADLDGVDFNTTLAVVTDVGEQFGAFNDGECKDLKKVLRGMASDSGKLGRIRLHEFYNKSLYTHWKFREKVEFLRDIGALDESGPQAAVIIPNYISAFTNCLKATSLYAVCCRNECEDLVGKLEQQIASPMATPEEIANLVENMSSDTVTAPRRLSQKLMERLSLMGSANDGKVHLHGRLFGQWMHHAFPLECPYPHEVGTTSPQTASEWMERTGSTAHHSEDEMSKAIEAACAVNSKQASDAETEELELPWTDAEELLVAKASGSHGAGGTRLLVLILAPALTLGAWCLLDRLPISQQIKSMVRKVLLFGCAAAILCATALVDVNLFALMALAILLLGALRQLIPTPRAIAKPEKCCV